MAVAVEDVGRPRLRPGRVIQWGRGLLVLPCVLNHVFRVGRGPAEADSQRGGGDDCDYNHCDYHVTLQARRPAVGREGLRLEPVEWAGIGGVCPVSRTGQRAIVIASAPGARWAATR